MGRDGTFEGPIRLNEEALPSKLRLNLAEGEKVRSREYRFGTGAAPVERAASPEQSDSAAGAP